MNQDLLYVRINKSLQIKLLLGCAYCGKRFVDANSIQDDWKYLRYLNVPVSLTIAGQNLFFICKQCYYKTIK